MKSIKYLILFSFLIVSCTNQAQKTDHSKIVISTKLNIRKSPNKNGKVIGVLKNGDYVEPAALDEGEYSECETLNKLYGCWIKIKYGNSHGYVFSPYLGNDYMLFYEDGYVSYFPNVKYWYGVYYDSTSQKDVMIEIEPFTEIVKNELEHEMEFQILKTKKREKSIFIIATNIKKKGKEIGLYTKNKQNHQGCLGYLAPGSKEYLYFESKGCTVSSECYNLIATGKYTMSKYGAIMSDYEIHIADNNPPNSRYSIIQNLSKNFEFIEAYTLVFHGDIDGDKKPDLILEGCSNSSCSKNLFLSSFAKENQLVGLASGYPIYSDL